MIFIVLGLDPIEKEERSPHQKTTRSKAPKNQDLQPLVKSHGAQMTPDQLVSEMPQVPWVAKATTSADRTK
jgi:hypothetical protein